MTGDSNIDILFTPRAWYEYTGWQLEDKKTLRRINKLIEDTIRHPFNGIGKPEALKALDGCWSRRIDETNRLVYKVAGPEDAKQLIIFQCKTHYE